MPPFTARARVAALARGRHRPDRRYEAPQVPRGDRRSGARAAPRRGARSDRRDRAAGRGRGRPLPRSGDDQARSLTRGEAVAMPLVTVHLLEGRTLDQKRRLLARGTDAPIEGAGAGGGEGAGPAAAPGPAARPFGSPGPAGGIDGVIAVDGVEAAMRGADHALPPVPPGGGGARDAPPRPAP